MLDLVVATLGPPTIDFYQSILLPECLLRSDKQDSVCLVHIATEQDYCASEFHRLDSPQTSESLFHVIYPPQDIHTSRIKGSIGTSILNEGWLQGPKAQLDSLIYHKSTSYNTSVHTQMLYIQLHRRQFHMNQQR